MFEEGSEQGMVLQSPSTDLIRNAFSNADIHLRLVGETLSGVADFRSEAIFHAWQNIRNKYAELNAMHKLNFNAHTLYPIFFGRAYIDDDNAGGSSYDQTLSMAKWILQLLRQQNDTHSIHKRKPLVYFLKVKCSSYGAYEIYERVNGMCVTLQHWK